MNETHDGAPLVADATGDPTGAMSGDLSDPAHTLGDADRDDAADDALDEDALDAEFEALIGKGGPFRAAYDKRMRRAITGRYRHYKEMERLTGTIQPILSQLAERHGFDPSDADAVSAFLRGLPDPAPQTPPPPPAPRPLENGNAGRSASLRQSDVAAMTGEDIRRIVALVENGAKIQF